MGSYDWLLGVAAIGIGGVIVFSVPEVRDAINAAISGAIPPADSTIPPTDTGVFDDTSADPTSGSGSTSGGGNICGNLCRNKQCSEYKQNCTTGCTYCCDSGPNSKPCSDSGTFGGGSDCGALCKAHNCVEYYRNCSKGCSNCNVDPSKKSGTGVSPCPKCRSGYHRTTGCTCKADSSSSQETLKQQTNNPKSAPSSKTQPKPKQASKCTSAGRACGFNKVWKTGGSTASHCVCAAKQAKVLSYPAQINDMGGREWKGRRAYSTVDYDYTQYQQRFRNRRTLGQFDFSNAYATQRTSNKYDYYYSRQNFNRTFGDNITFSNIG